MYLAQNLRSYSGKPRAVTRHDVWSRAARRGRVREEARVAVEAHLVRVRARVRLGLGLGLELGLGLGLANLLTLTLTLTLALALALTLTLGSQAHGGELRVERAEGDVGGGLQVAAQRGGEPARAHVVHVGLLSIRVRGSVRVRVRVRVSVRVRVTPACPPSRTLSTRVAGWIT